MQILMNVHKISITVTTSALIPLDLSPAPVTMGLDWPVIKEHAIVSLSDAQIVTNCLKKVPVSFTSLTLFQTLMSAQKGVMIVHRGVQILWVPTLAPVTVDSH